LQALKITSSRCFWKREFVLFSDVDE